MHRYVQVAGTLAVVLLAATAVRAQDSADPGALKDKVQLLEKKVAALEAQVALLQPLRQEYEQRENLRKETEEFRGSPGPIESTNRPIAADAALKPGQILQVEQGGAWWAGKILALLPNGGVKVHYIGWASNWDEEVPRTRLQLDPDAASKAKKPISAPNVGLVPDTETAIAIAVAVWNPIYGKDQIAKEKPYKARLSQGIWTVEGTLPEGMEGGVAEADISKDDGRILRVIHGK